MAGLPTAAAVLTLRDVTKRYRPDQRPAVESLSLTVPAGEVCVLVGPSGCGKTTALKTINRLIEPTSGDILINETSVRSLRPADLRRRIGYVIQHVGLMPHLTVAANVATVPRLNGWDRERTRGRVAELLELIGLPSDEYGGRYPAELSGGQQQRVGLARALASDPPLMLMDEPFSAVDPITRERLQNDFLRLHRLVPKTVVFVTHDIDEAIKMADRIAVMRDGRLVQYATPAELLAAPTDEFVADFVGADRALKGLSLSRLEDIDLVDAPAVTVGQAVADVRERIASGALVPVDGDVIVVDRLHRPVNWLPTRAFDTLERIPGARVAGRVEPKLDRVTTLRDALSALFEAGARFGVVVDGEGRVVGLVSANEIADGVRRTRAEVAAGG